LGANNDASVLREDHFSSKNDHNGMVDWFCSGEVRYYKGEMFFAWRDANAPDGSEQGLKLNTMRSYAAGVVGGFLCTVAIAPCPRHLQSPPRARCRSRAHAALRFDSSNDWARSASSTTSTISEP